MDQVLLFGILLTVLPLLTIKKYKEESKTQKFFHIGSLIAGIILLVLFTVQFMAIISN